MRVAIRNSHKIQILTEEQTPFRAEWMTEGEWEEWLISFVLRDKDVLLWINDREGRLGEIVRVVDMDADEFPLASVPFPVDMSGKNQKRDPNYDYYDIAVRFAEWQHSTPYDVYHWQQWGSPWEIRNICQEMVDKYQPQEDAVYWEAILTRENGDDIRFSLVSMSAPLVQIYKEPEEPDYAVLGEVYGAIADDDFVVEIDATVGLMVYGSNDRILSYPSSSKVRLWLEDEELRIKEIDAIGSEPKPSIETEKPEYTVLANINEELDCRVYHSVDGDIWIEDGEGTEIIHDESGGFHRDYIHIWYEDGEIRAKTLSKFI